MTEATGRFAPGQRIGDYELVTRLAAGGMAELFVARRSGLQGFEKFVVLKRILPELAHHADFVDMFLHEARIAATLEHPNIVPVFDFGRADRDYFFVMPYVHGRDLLAVLRASHDASRRLPIGLAVRTASSIAAALHYAHEHRGFDGQPLDIVHRDISPANVLVTYDGHVKVVDFGIAKAAARTNVTRVGVRKGKAAYMSPEQCRGEELDRRSDIWSIGVVLWEMTMMRRLFRGGNDLALMNRITTTDVPPPSLEDPTYPPGLERIVLRCLRRDRAARYPDALTLQQDLDAFAREQGLDTSAAAFAHHLGEVLGPPSYPWSSSVAGLPVAASGGARLSEFVALSATDHGSPDQITSTEARGVGSDSSALRSLGWLGAGTLLGLLAIGATWAAAANRDPPTVAAAHTNASTPPDPATLLPLVNQPDPALALPYPQRHAILEHLAAHPEVYARVDGHLNAGLDLIQAEQADVPCRAYSDALNEIARLDDAALAATVRDTPVPTTGRGCETVKAQRDAVLGRLQAP